MIDQTYNIRFGRIGYLPEIVDSAASVDKSNIPKGNIKIKANLSTDSWKTLLTFLVNKKTSSEFSTLSTISTVIAIYYFNNIIMKEHLINENNDTSFSIKKIVKWKFINIKI